MKKVAFSPSEDIKSLNAKVEWTVTGSVNHWGHIHMRENAYQADIGLDASSGSWKMTKMDLISEERLF